VGRFKIRFAVASYCAKVSNSFLRVLVASVSFAWVGVLFGSLEEEVVVSGIRLGEDKNESGNYCISANSFWNRGIMFLIPCSNWTRV